MAGVRGCRCVFFMVTVLLLDRGGAGAGGAAALALQRLLAGAQRVPATQTAAAQVPLQHHVTSRKRPLKTRTEGHENEERWVTNMKNMQEAQFCQTAGFVALRTLTTDPVTLARGHVISRDPERTLWPQAYCVSLGALWHGSGFVYTQRNCSSKRRPCTTLTVEATPSERTWRRIKIFEAEYGAQNHAVRNFRLNETKSKSHLE